MCDQISIWVLCKSFPPNVGVFPKKNKVCGCGSVQKKPQHVVLCAIFLRLFRILKESETRQHEPQSTKLGPFSLSLSLSLVSWNMRVAIRPVYLPTVDGNYHQNTFFFP
jgi:hypothetical protein